MILVGEWRAKQRHDPVAHHLVHRALIAVNGLHHPFQDGIENLARILRIAISEQLHRALEVGEKHRNLLALSFKGALGGEDLLGEVLRGIRLWRAEPRLDAALCCRQRLATTPAELLATL